MAFKILALTGLAPVAAIVLHTNAGYNFGSSKCPCVTGVCVTSVFFLRGFSMFFLGYLGIEPGGWFPLKQLLMCALIVVVIVGSGLLS